MFGVVVGLVGVPLELRCPCKICLNSSDIETGHIHEQTNGASGRRLGGAKSAVSRELAPVLLLARLALAAPKRRPLAQNQVESAAHKWQSRTIMVDVFSSLGPL